jgi:sugar lactone lactonase YvrE
LLTAVYWQELQSNEAHRMFLTEAPTCVAPVGDRCGEGLVWRDSEQALYWADINRFLIHRFDPRDVLVLR